MYLSMTRMCAVDSPNTLCIFILSLWQIHYSITFVHHQTTPTRLQSRLHALLPAYKKLFHRYPREIEGATPTTAISCFFKSSSLLRASEYARAC